MKQEKLFLGLLAASSAHADASRKAFARLNLTEAQPKVLYLLRRTGAIVQKELAEVCSVRQSTLTVLLSKMERDGLIMREACFVSGKKRANRVLLTQKGQEKAEQLEDEVEKLEEKGFAGFSEQERLLLLQMLGRVEDNMREE